MTCYFRKRDTIVVGLSLFSPKILKYRLHNMDSSFVGVALKDYGTKTTYKILNNSIEMRTSFFCISILLSLTQKESYILDLNHTHQEIRTLNTKIINKHKLS